MPTSRLHRLRFLSLLLLADATACGADFLTGGGSARLVGAGGVYMPSSDNVVDAMAINPAGLALLTAPRLDFAIEGALATGQFVDTVNSAGRLSSVGAIPYGAFGTPLGNGLPTGHFTLAAAALPELLSSAKWTYTDPPGFSGVSYGLLHSTSSITAVRAAAGLGVYLNPRIQLGMTLGATYNTNTLETAYVFQSYQPLAGLKTLLNLHTAGVGWNGTAGALVRASHNVQLGFAYHSRTGIRSTGTATGNAGVQFAAIGLGSARPDFRYDAEVDNVLPQSLIASATWQATSKLRVAAQVDWINWRTAFTRLPVILTQGSNPDINALLGTNAFTDYVPLDWHNQTVASMGIERPWRERVVLRAGYTHVNSPVPGSTLSPLTSAITRHTLSAGASYSVGRWRLDMACSADPSVTQVAGRSALKSGEFSNSSVKVGTQAIVMGLSIRL